VWRVAAGGGGGFVLLHPASMLIVGLTSPERHQFWVPIVNALTPEHLPMGIFFFVLGALAGYVHHRNVERLLAQARIHQALRLEREQFEVLLQTAGAVCHEFGQPMTVVRVRAEMLQEKVPADSPAGEDLSEIVTNVDRMAHQMRLLQNVTKYVTKPYIGGVRIIDIEKATERQSHVSPIVCERPGSP
jgi:signal transduction histidine kinase